MLDRPVEPQQLLVPAPLPSGVSLEPALDLVSGRVTGYTEVLVEPDAVTGDARTSSSMQRDPAPYSDWVRGQNTYRPFAPAGPAPTATDNDGDGDADGSAPAAQSISAEWASGSRGTAGRWPTWSSRQR